MSLPDSISAPIVAALETAGGRHVAVTREGEAFAIAAGLWLGGARPLVIIQNTGLLESGDALRGTVLRMGVPLVFVVTCRGYDGLAPEHCDPANYLEHRELLVDPSLDTVAMFTEPTLRAWGIPTFNADEDGAAQIERAFDLAEREQRPVAVLITRPTADA